MKKLLIGTTYENQYSFKTRANGVSGGNMCSISLGGDGTYPNTNKIKALIDSGQPVMTHSTLTGDGHMIEIIGYDENGWIINDPAGNSRLPGYPNGRTNPVGGIGNNIPFDSKGIGARPYYIIQETQ